MSRHNASSILFSAATALPTPPLSQGKLLRFAAVPVGLLTSIVSTCAQTPTITSVTHAATSIVGPVAPGELIIIRGTNLGPSTPASMQLGVDGSVDTNLAGTRVLFDGVAAPMLAARSDQVRTVVPFSLAGQQTTRLQMELQGNLSQPVDLPVTETAPGIFTAGAITVNQQGSVPASILNQDNSVNGPSNPAEKGSVVVFYATGGGQTSPASSDGSISATILPQPVAPIGVTIGGQTGEIIYAGAAGGMVAGVLQISVRIPRDLTGGNGIPIVLTIGNVTSPPGVTMVVREPTQLLNVTGLWSGSASDSTGPGSMTWQLTQTGTSVSGTVKTATPSGTVVFTGTFSGTLSGTTMVFTINVPRGGISVLPTCTATITGTVASITSITMTGTYAGTNSCTGSFSNGRFTLNKQ